MSTRQNFGAAVFHFFDTFWLAAYIFKGFFLTEWVTFHNFKAKSTFTCDWVFFDILTRFSNMVRLTFAFSTEILLTIATSDSEISHMFCGNFWNWLTLVVLLFVIWLAGIDSENGTTIASHHRGIVFDSRLELCIFDLLREFWAKYFCYLLDTDTLITCRAFSFIKLDFFVFFLFF